MTEPDDLLPKRADDPLQRLKSEDLDRLSLAELDARVAALEAEIRRTRAKREAAGSFRASADMLFRKGG